MICVTCRQISSTTKKNCPYYYRVFLDDDQIEAEISATARCGLPRLKFPAEKESLLLFDVSETLGNAIPKTVNDHETIWFAHT